MSDPMFDRVRTIGIVAAIVITLDACNGGTSVLTPNPIRHASPSPAPSKPTPTLPPIAPTPTATPTLIPTTTPQGVVSADPSSLEFGNATPQNTVVSESDVPDATFASSTTTCNGIASISTTDRKTFTITPNTPLVAGNCSFTFTAGDGATGSVNVAVTTTTIGISSRVRK